LEGRGRQISELEASLVYKVSSRTARATQRNPAWKKKFFSLIHYSPVSLPSFPEIPGPLTVLFHLHSFASFQKREVLPGMSTKYSSL